MHFSQPVPEQQLQPGDGLYETRNILRYSFETTYNPIFYDKMKSTSYIFLALVMILASCKPLSSLGIKKYPADPIRRENLSVLNGIYSNKYDTILGRLSHGPHAGFNPMANTSAVTQLFWSVPEAYYRNGNGDEIRPEDKWVKLEFSTKKKAFVSLYEKETLLFSKKIHGKLKNNFFYLRPKAFVLPFVPLLFGYNFERARIGKSGDNLIIDYSINRWGFALVAGSSDRGYTSSVYKNKAH